MRKLLCLSTAIVSVPLALHLLTKAHMLFESLANETILYAPFISALTLVSVVPYCTRGMQLLTSGAILRAINSYKYSV